MQCSIAKISKPMDPKIIDINLKKQKSYKMYNYKKNLKYFIKSRSNSSNKADKQMSEAKTVMEIKL